MTLQNSSNAVWDYLAGDWKEIAPRRPANDAYAELRAAMRACDDLGFDTTTEAMHAVLSHPDFAERWECSDRLIEAVSYYHRVH